MASFYVPLCVMVVVYVKILRVVADKKKEMSWKLRPAATHQTKNTEPLEHPTTNDYIYPAPNLHQSLKKGIFSLLSCEKSGPM